jgi:proline iminopeptidase
MLQACLLKICEHTSRTEFWVRRQHLQIPTLVIHAALDPRPARVARHLAQCMPSASYVELPNVGHLPWIEQPDLLRGVLRPFLERLS